MHIDTRLCTAVFFVFFFPAGGGRREGGGTAGVQIIVVYRLGLGFGLVPSIVKNTTM